MNYSDKDRSTHNFILVNEFTEYGVEKFKVNFDRLHSSNFPMIPIYIDSYGGEIYSLLAMIDIIEASEVPVATIAMGKAMSCGSILLACGSEGRRFIGHHSTVMIHDAAAVSFGKIEDLKADVGEAERLNNVIFELLARKCGHKNMSYFKSHISSRKHVNWYLNATQAKEHGLVDHIGLPIMGTHFILDVSKNSDAAKSSEEKNEKVVLRKKRKPVKKSRSK